MSENRVNTSEADIFPALSTAQQTGEAVALATVIRTVGSMPRHAGSKLLVFADGRTVGTVGGGAMEARVIRDAQAALQDGKTRLQSYTLNDLTAGDPGVCGGTAEIFIEPMGSRPVLVVIGCGHVGKALAELGKWAGFRVLVADDRPEFCNPQFIPNMDGYLVAAPGEIAAKIPQGPHTFVAAVTRGLAIDELIFPALLNMPLGYLGLIGSRRRWLLTVRALEAKGFSRETLARVHAPIGLELNAETPAEIAVSILAEIIMERRGGNGQPMRWLGRTEESTLDQAP